MSGATEAHLAATLLELEAKMERVWEFVKDRNDDISVGVRRAFKPMSVCADCDQIEDHAIGVMCKCWSPITEADLDQLGWFGVETRIACAVCDHSTPGEHWAGCPELGA